MSQRRKRSADKGAGSAPAPDLAPAPDPALERALTKPRRKAGAAAPESAPETGPETGPETTSGGGAKAAKAANPGRKQKKSRATPAPAEPVEAHLEPRLEALIAARVAAGIAAHLAAGKKAEKQAEKQAKKQARKQAPKQVRSPEQAAEQTAEQDPAAQRTPIHPEPFLDIPDAGIPDAEIIERLPPDPALLERSRAQWELGDWDRLAALAALPLEDHPDRAKLALLAGVGLAQTGDMGAARVQLRRAQDWGCPRDLLARVLVAGAHNSLGRVASLHGDEARALGHFETSVGTVSPRADAQVLGRARNIHEKARLGQLPEAARLLDHGLTEARRDPAPGRETLEHFASGLALLQIEVEALRQHRPPSPGARLPRHAEDGPQDQDSRAAARAAAKAAESRAPRSRVAPPFVVVVAGVPRSGSTWVYNAVRLLCAGNGLSYHAGWHADYDPAAHRGTDLHVVKLHDPAELDFTVHRILTSQRDLVERLASHVRMGWTRPEPEAIRASALRMAKLAEYWAARSDHETRFVDIAERPQEVVQAIAAALDLPCDPALARRIAADLAELPDRDSAGPDAQGPTDSHEHDPATLLHPGHRATAQDRAAYLALVRKALAQRPG